MGLSDKPTEEEILFSNEMFNDPSALLRREMNETEQKEYERLINRGYAHKAWIYKTRCICDAEDFTLYVPDEGEIKLLRWKDLTGQLYVYAPIRYVQFIGILCVKALKDNYGVYAGIGFPSSYEHEGFWSKIYDDDKLVFHKKKRKNFLSRIFNGKIF